MGCDIHMLTEKRRVRPRTVDTGKEIQPWVNVDHFRHNSYRQEDPKDTDEKMLEIVPVYRERDYYLFTRLAGVRKELGETTPVFAEPRGIPKDISSVSRREVKRWGVDGHSHSYATYAELENYFHSQAFDSHQFRIMLEALKKRMREEFWLSEREEPKPEHKENFRVVFFFDN